MIELPVIENSESNEDTPRSRYWRSLSEQQNTAEFQRVAGEEFIPGASDAPGGATRRQFMQLMGASMAMAGLTACRRPVETILPFAQMPEDMVPGVPVQYATAMPFRGSVQPVLVQSFDGRPTKIEGNPDHVDSLGVSSQFAQASLLGLYDPDRMNAATLNGEASNWNAFKAFAAQLPASSNVAVLAGASSSMTFAAARKQFEQRFSSVRWVNYNWAEGNAAQGIAAAKGQAYRALHSFENAKVIVSLDADFLGSGAQDASSNTRGFSAGRNVEENGEMNRLYVIESGYSITGGMADNRLRLKSSEVASFAAALATELGAYDGDMGVHGSHAWIGELANDLRAAGPAGIIVAGDHQPAGVHALVAAMNASIGAVGTTVRYVDAGEEATDLGADLDALKASMSAGEIDVVITLGVNPIYDVAGFGDAYAQVADRIHVGLHVDETAQAATWSIPQTHFLEEWGDGHSRSGVVSVIQPLIAPLYEDAHSNLEVIALLANGTEQFGYDLVRATWRSRLKVGFEKAWRKVVHDGFSDAAAYSIASGAISSTGVSKAMSDVPVSAHSGTEVVIRPDSKVFDGRFANNVWLQELPDPTTKVVWDNVAQMNPITAEKLGVRSDLNGGKYFTDTIRIESGGNDVIVPVWIQPGLADDSIQVTLGYGRDLKSDRPERETSLFDLDNYTDVYGHGCISTGVGSNVSPLAQHGFVATATVTKEGSGYLVVSTQDHGAIQEEADIAEKRGLFRQATVSEYNADPEFVKAGEPAPIREDWSDYPTLWQANHPSEQNPITNSIYHENQWGMVIDLNTCTGCTACAVACQAENNIEVVGKEEVGNGREMAWIRTDRYFVSEKDGSFDNPQMVLQPLPCQHCENAPCEQVCPVSATVHSPDGTNQMIYNRCIGTRYCANNCPYKVRRFNFYNWTKTLPETVHMAHNPNVTVRSRGVMEKCSFCIQRIRGANKTANVENRSLQEGEVVTACQQACPAQAITFGNVADANSAVSLKRGSDRRYELLAELNVKPRVSYLGRIRNPNTNLS
ncbi:MAG: TAT-variant-translocated molybdopterin oxidoreductase [Bacteroidetes Order II. Incertae sedis bacterium]|jgi:molybdopterin-containing oxidoreductase family iron-sulfur binding subunit|nr:TAT-variant-translocated molybdopterin oxidoreductase [Bacteroidetes Order II. bacterium]MBT4051788.1 TAT-variant-translocated molybdopterin oxidoreductase [Bacteroidetes Order II. bacterium]MBT4601645.1 TAT-variant-translocated molybdopterin oxidoreductase [Bacteroidetes Order II. bacterium]MBT5249448.1 TAT-variant-translocated molybdopterin oxidoreductase [Bacteroidetes Order II. bacterium]MBT6201489.1 TAT-variant-translocated molybdopterin oxidoreductase [Bacteroidetes Order II. bacterium